MRRGTSKHLKNPTNRSVHSNTNDSRTTKLQIAAEAQTKKKEEEEEEEEAVTLAYFPAQQPLAPSPWPLPTDTQRWRKLTMHRQDDKNTRGRKKGFSERFKEMVFSAIPTNGSSYRGRFCQDFVT
jgi:hypothetical protein